MTFIPSVSCDSTNSRSNRSINTSRFPRCNVYCRSSAIGQQVSVGGASGFSIGKTCAANGTVAIRNFNARKIDILELIQRFDRKPLTMDAVKHSVPKPVPETLRERRFYQRMSGTNVEGSLSKDRRMLRHCCLQQQSATIARYSPFCRS